MDKKALYEKIISNVAVEVKRAINEDYHGSDLHDDLKALTKTVCKICNKYDVTCMLLDDTIHSYYNNAELDDLGTEIDLIDVYDDRFYIRTIGRDIIKPENLSSKDLDTVYYIIRGIVPDYVDYVDVDEILDEIDDTYDQIVNGEYNGVELVMTDEDKEHLFEAFEQSGYEECNFLQALGQPFILNSMYQGEEASLEILSCNLTCQLSGGITVRLEDIITDRDDIDNLYDEIINYVE